VPEGINAWEGQPVDVVLLCPASATGGLPSARNLRVSWKEWKTRGLWWSLVEDIRQDSLSSSPGTLLSVLAIPTRRALLSVRAYRVVCAAGS
jgi:hypothetical protein